MSNELSNLQQQIQQALQLLRESNILATAQQKSTHGSLPATDLVFTEQSSLLEKCAQVCAQYQEQKPTIRIIHHLACSGGTLISKCLSAMPNIFLLSEVHPYSNLHLGGKKPKFLPTDIASLSRYARIPDLERLHKDLFISNIKIAHEHVKRNGGSLLLRDHTHSDFHTELEPKNTPAIINVLAENFNIQSVITFRNPIDSYLSLQANGWVHFTPPSFEEYCARILKMLNIYNSCPVFHYESFVFSPEKILMEICNALSISYNESWSLYFDIAQVSGDSGRSGSTIVERPRREMEESFKKEMLQSKSYEEIKFRFDY